jgi:DNA-binding CsgD family transcriptional regulator
MSIWKTLQSLRKSSRKKKRNFNTLDHSLSERELRSIFDFQIKDDREQFWNSLSPREKDVTALTCLRFTNLQIAGRLQISIETVKSYIKQVLNKSGLKTKADLRVYFAEWDFSAWERRKDPYR